MSPPTLDQLIRRIVGAAFDAGQASAGRPAADRAKVREDQLVYGLAVLRGHVEIEAARLSKDAA